jgi:hypothetical protein
MDALQPSEIIQLALDIYEHAAAQVVAGKGWDFEPVAEASCNAAEAFSRVLTRRTPLKPTIEQQELAARQAQDQVQVLPQVTPSEEDKSTEPSTPK